jgi:hypothetical protein
MSLPRLAKSLGLCCLLGAGLLVGAPRAHAGLLGYFGCVDGCCDHQCCPKFRHCQEGPPKIKMKWGCSRPVCEPCSLEHYGYYRPCWQAWPFPPDWTHCPVPPPSELPPGNAPGAGAKGSPEALTSPRRVRDK